MNAENTSETPKAVSTSAASGGSEDWVSTKEAARLLGITARTLYRFINDGSLPAYRFGRVIRVRRTELNAFVESCKIEPGALEHLYPEPASD